MKRLEGTIYETYSPVSLWLDDVRELIGILQRNNVEFTIQADEYEYESMEELLQSKGNHTIGSLQLTSRRPPLRLELLKTRASLYLGSDNAFATGIYHQLHSRIKKCLRRPPWLFSYNTLFIFSLLSGGTVPTLIAGRYIYGLFPYALLLGLIVWAQSIRGSRHSQILLSNQRGLSQFVVSNRDSLIVATVASVIGAIVGILGTLLLTFRK